MMNYIAILTFQIMFNIFKVLEIKFTYENQLNRLLINSVWINLVSLASVYFSLDSLLKGDMWVLPFYIGGSVLGKWIAMTQMDNLESKLFIFFKTKEDAEHDVQVQSNRLKEDFGMFHIDIQKDRSLVNGKIVIVVHQYVLR